MFLTFADVSALHKKLMNGENVPDEFQHLYALSADKKRFVIISYCRFDRGADGYLSNFFPNSEGVGENIISCIVMDNGGFVTGYPIPDSFQTVSAVFVNDKLRLESSDGRTVVFETFLPIAFITKPMTMAELEKAFYECGDSPQPAKRTKPKAFVSVPGVGRLKFADDTENYHIKLNGADHYIEALDAAQMKKAKSNLLYMYENSDSLIFAAKEFAAEKLLKTKNEGWLEDDELPLTKSGFTERMTLSSVNIGCEELCFTFDDGGLFWGHCIEAVLTVGGKGLSADILG